MKHQLLDFPRVATHGHAWPRMATHDAARGQAWPHAWPDRGAFMSRIVQNMAGTVVVIDCGTWGIHADISRRVLSVSKYLVAIGGRQKFTHGRPKPRMATHGAYRYN